MCRYAFSGPYKNHYACFTCRKAFKQPPIEDWLVVRGQGHIYRELFRLWALGRGLEQREAELSVRLSDLQAEYRDASRKCPECGEPMIDMGLDFKPPPQSDIKAWRILHGLFRTGHEFHTCGCFGPGFIPKSTGNFRQYLEGRKQLYTSHLRSAQESTDLSAERKREAASYWADRIAAVERELAALR